MAPSNVLQDICKGVMYGALSYPHEPDVKIAFDTSQEIRVRIDLIQTGDAIERIHATVHFFEGSVASMSDLLRLRTMTVVDRGSDGEVEDFRWLLSKSNTVKGDVKQQQKFNFVTCLIKGWLQSSLFSLACFFCSSGIRSEFKVNSPW